MKRRKTAAWLNVCGVIYKMRLAPGGNTLGLFDMSGPVREWCYDGCPAADYMRVFRDGSFNRAGETIAVGFQTCGQPQNMSKAHDFRFARSIPVD